MQQPGAKREMGGTDFKWGGPGTTGPPAGDGPVGGTKEWAANIPL